MAWTPTLDGDGGASDNQQHAKVIRPLADLEREAILDAVECCGAEEAARRLGIGTSTLYRKLLLYRAALAPQSHDAKTFITIPLENMRASWKSIREC